MMDRWPMEAPASMTVGGILVPKAGWNSFTLAVWAILADGSMVGRCLGMGNMREGEVEKRCGDGCHMSIDKMET